MVSKINVNTDLSFLQLQSLSMVSWFTLETNYDM